MALLGTLIVGGVAVAGAYSIVAAYRKKLRREQYIREFRLPRGLYDKLSQKYPSFGIKEQQLVARGLRQFFLAYLKSGCQRVAMPSQVADDLWHEFILHTRDYAHFCDQAFGQFLHHTPAVKLGAQRADNEGLRRVWWQVCKEENIDPRKPTRLPLLFALDRKLAIPNGFIYDLNCQRSMADIRNGGTVGAQCASHFSDPGVDGSTDGFGDGGSGGDGGCSGGCGGD